MVLSSCAPLTLERTLCTGARLGNTRLSTRARATKRETAMSIDRQNKAAPTGNLQMRRLWFTIHRWLALALVSSPAFVHAAETLTNAEVVTLSERGVPAAVIVAKIAASRTDFDMSVQQLLALSEAGVAPEVLKAMARAGQPGLSVRSAPGIPTNPDVARTRAAERPNLLQSWQAEDAEKERRRQAEEEAERQREAAEQERAQQSLQRWYEEEYEACLARHRQQMERNRQQLEEWQENAQGQEHYEKELKKVKKLAAAQLALSGAGMLACRQYRP